MESLLPFDFVRNSKVCINPANGDVYASRQSTLSGMMELQRYLGKTLEPVWLEEKAFEEKVQALYAGHAGRSSTVMEDVQQHLDLNSLSKSVQQSMDLLDGASEAPIIRLLNAIIAEALNEKASDIHVESYADQARVRFRLDGVLRTVLAPSMEVLPLVISRIKVMGGLDISEKRLPQDGRIAVKLGGRSVDLRVSTIPSSHGERVVLRLLDKQALRLTVDDLGLSDQQKTLLCQLIARPHGMLLVTGPTGSGKTSTLYAALASMDSSQLNIMTVEDPVEYDLVGVSQTPINVRAGMSFSKGLRAILRQDPDVVLIGEIRDAETAEIAVQASLTGHLMLSTLHTNTAAGAVVRLRDLGVDSFLIASTLRGVLAQRLVRKLCSHCKRSAVPSPLLLQQFTQDTADLVVYEPVGCVECNGTGYSGRQVIVEVVDMKPHLQTLIHSGAGEMELEAALREDVPSLLDAGCRLVAAGVTSFDEVLRVTSA